MRALITLLAFITVTLAATAQDATFWQQAGGPNDSTTIIGLGESHDGCIFVTTMQPGGIFRSCDAGATFTQDSAGFGRYTVNSQVLENRDSVLFVCSWRGVFRSMDNGDRWSLLNGFPPDVMERHPVFYQMCVSSGARTVFVGVALNGDVPCEYRIYRSTDDGETWGLFESLETIPYFACVFSGDGIGILGDWRGDWYHLSDVDTARSRFVPTGMPPGKPFMMSSGNAFISWTGNPREIFRSSDGGNVWVVCDSASTLPEMSIEAMTSDRRGNLLALMREGDLYESNDAGSIWERIGSFQHRSGNWVWSMLVRRGDTILARTESGICLRTTDRGTTWRPAALDFSGVGIFAVMLRGDDQIVAGGMNYVYRTTDDGDSWMRSQRMTTFDNTLVVALATDERGSLFAGTSGFNGGEVYRSLDGSTWEPITHGLSGASFVFAIVCLGHDSIIIGTYGGGIFRSTNGGNSWDRSSTGLPTANVFSLLSTRSGTVLAGTEENGIYGSTDDGRSWMDHNNGIYDGTVSCMVEGSDGAIYAGTSGGSVYRSIDDGRSWTKSFLGVCDQTIYALAMNDRGVLFAGTGYKDNNVVIYGSVYRSLDSATHWEELPLGESNSTIHGLVINGRGRLFAGLNGVWRSVSSTTASVPPMQTCPYLTAGLHVTGGGASPSSIEIEFDLARSGVVRLSIYDASGREVRVLLHVDQTAGRHRITVDTSMLAGGPYFLRLVAGDRPVIVPLSIAR